MHIFENIFVTCNFFLGKHEKNFFFIKIRNLIWYSEISFSRSHITEPCFSQSILWKLWSLIWPQLFCRKLSEAHVGLSTLNNTQSRALSRLFSSPPHSFFLLLMMDCLWGMMNLILSGPQHFLIWDSALRRKEHQHHPALHSEYISRVLKQDSHGRGFQIQIELQHGKALFRKENKKTILKLIKFAYLKYTFYKLSIISVLYVEKCLICSGHRQILLGFWF